MLCLFVSMVIDISAIKKSVSGLKETSLIKAKRAEHRGDKTAAIGYYQDVIFDIENKIYKVQATSKEAFIEKIKEKIEKLNS